MKEKNLLKAAAVPAGTIAVAAMSGMAVLANDDVQAVPDEGSEVQIETFALDDPTNTEISTEESQASLGTIEADQDKANESLDVVVPQPDCTTEMMPTPPEPNPEKDRIRPRSIMWKRSMAIRYPVWLRMIRLRRRWKLRSTSH